MGFLSRLYLRGLPLLLWTLNTMVLTAHGQEMNFEALIITMVDKEDEKAAREQEQRRVRQEERRAEMKSRHDEIRKKYGLFKEENPYAKFENN
ncbi:hypothetical protein E2320_008854 [Naja naja]|nr:hypothetical protein E2320_008854 [Naja naja]